MLRFARELEKVGVFEFGLTDDMMGLWGQARGWDHAASIGHQETCSYAPKVARTGGEF